MLETTLAQKIIEWKAKWGIISSIHISGESASSVFYYRGLTAYESIHIKSLIDSNQKGADWDSVIVSIALLYPSISDIRLPGTINILATNIIAASNPDEDSLKNQINSAREWVEKATHDSFSLNLCTTICRVYPYLNLIDLLNLPIDHLINLGAIVELITNTKIFDIDTKSTTEDIKASPIPNAEALPQETLSNINTASESLRRAILDARKNFNKNKK